MSPESTALTTDLIAHWPFEDDVNHRGADSLQTINHNVTLAPSRCDAQRKVAHFNGLDSYLEIPDHPHLNWGDGEFSLSVWIETEATSDIVGDILSKFDSGARRGWTLNVVTNGGVTSAAQANYRHLHFGIDNGITAAGWQDCGRPGNAVFIYSLSAINGELYAGTFEREADESGHLWRYDGNNGWVDCGAAPDGSNSVPSAIAFDGAIYCATGRYNPVGSRLGPPRNTRPGGSVYRIEADGSWTDCGRPGSEDAVPESTPTSGYETGKADLTTALTVYRGKLYATSFHRRGAFVYEGGKNWKYIGPDQRLMTFTVFQDRLYALVNGGPVYRYEDGETWTYCGMPGDSDQTYSAAIYKGDLLVGTWPGCEVLRYRGGEDWESFGNAGYEKEVMAMVLYNAKIYFGTLPMANAWRLDDGDYTYMGNVDNSPEVFLRRLWSMSVYQGKLFAGTLPSGHILSFEAGRMATHDRTLPAGRHHVAAVRDGSRLRLYLDGREVAQSTAFNQSDFDLGNSQHLQIGFGPHQHFRGAMSNLRLYGRALTAQEIAQLASA